MSERLRGASVNEESVQLNSEQKHAVQFGEGPLLIVAGAGTGKTRVITERVRWLIKTGRAKPSEILALTFTEKVAGEMLERIDRSMPLGYEEPWISTFHAFGDRILRQEALEIGLDPDYKIITQSEQWLLVKRHLFDFDLDYYRPLGNPSKFIRAMLRLFSRLQDESTSPAEFLSWAKSQSKLPNLELEEKEKAQKYLELARAYQKYRDLKIAESKLDFGDLITWTLNLFHQRPSVLQKYRRQFKYILVDEFQDTNFAQFQLLKVLAPARESPNLTVCADDDQSIYKFRGAAVSNVLNFKKDYPNAATVVLIKNYRSGQVILNAAYRLIKNNNPDRLEVKLGIAKELMGARGEGKTPQLLVAETAEEEAERVVTEILKLKAQNSKLVWKDFAILARANNHLDSFVAALKRRQVSYQRVGNRGLFDQPEVRDLIALLRVVANPTDSLALYRVLGFPFLDISGPVIITLLSAARAQQKTLWDEVRAQTGAENGFEKLVSLVEGAQNDLINIVPSQLLYNLVSELGYLEKYLVEDSLENQLKINNLDLFLGVIKRFETEVLSQTTLGVSRQAGLLEFLDYLDLLAEAGENPAQAEIEDIDTVNLLTVHRAKGLEFPIVFLVSLVSDRFPTRRRRDPIPLPGELVKETLPEGDSHLQEERRLFYVGCTRARDQLFLTWAKKYGRGVREKKPSGFIEELGKDVRSFPAEQGSVSGSLVSGVFSGVRKLPNATSPPVRKLDHVSYSQLDTFNVCPLRYKYRYVLRIPVPTNHALSFGKTIHETLRLFHQKKDLAKIPVSWNDLLLIYDRAWIDEGYSTVEHKDQRYQSGKELLKDYYEKHSELLGRPIYLEKKFRLRLGGIPLVGFIDRIDQAPDGSLELIDYKTGAVKEQRAVDRDEQLSIYALASREVLGVIPQVLSFYFFGQNQKVSTQRSAEYLEKKKQEITNRIYQIEHDPLEPKAGRWCKWCDYQKVCPAYRIGQV